MTLRPDTLATLLAALLLLALFDRTRRRLWLFVPLALPATLLHETAHWIVAQVSGARPARFSVWPRRDGKRIVLGEVAITHGTWLTRGLVGLAPLLWLPFALWAVQAVPQPESVVARAGYAYALASLIYGALPSRSDWRLAIRGPIGALLILVIVAICCAWVWQRVN